MINKIFLFHHIYPDAIYLNRWTNSNSESNKNFIDLLATDEPIEWIRWLQNPSGRPGEENGSNRLEQQSIRLLPASSLCITQFNDSVDINFECEGSRIVF